MKIKIIYIAEDGIEREEVHGVRLQSTPSWVEIDVPKNEVRITMPSRPLEQVVRELIDAADEAGEEARGAVMWERIEEARKILAAGSRARRCAHGPESVD